jgi:hypothetical protein
VSYPPDRQQFRFDRHDASCERPPVVLVRHGHPYRLGAALEELRQRPSQLPRIPASYRVCNASGEFQVEADGYPQLTSREPFTIVRWRDERRAGRRHPAGNAPRLPERPVRAAVGRR